MVSREIGRTQFVRYIVKIGEKGRKRMVSLFFCSVDYFPLTASAYPPQETPEAAQRADPAAAHPDPLTAHHGKPCLERLGLLGRHGFDNVQNPSFFLLCLCIFSSSAHHFPSLCTNSTHFFWLNRLPQNRISPTVPMSSLTGHPRGYAGFF